MRAGSLRHRITIQRPMTAVNAQGGKIKIWVDVATVWAVKIPLSGREIEQNMQHESELTTRYLIRYRRLIDSNMRIKDGSNYCKIISIINIEAKNKDIEIFAEETKDFD